MNSHGYTESHYKGPLGEGAGAAAPLRAAIAVLPRRLLPAPLVWLAHDKLLETRPKLALAFLVAQQEALAALAARKDLGGRVGPREGLLEARSRRRRPDR